MTTTFQGQVQVDTAQATGAISQLANAATQAAGASNSFHSELQTGTQRIQGVAGAVQGLVSQLGSTNRTAGLVASIAASTVQFSQLGAMLGPGGAVLGGLVGLGTAIVGLVNQHEDAAEAAREQAEALDELGESVISLGELMMEWGEEGAINNAISRGGAALSRLSEGTLEREANARRARLLELEVANAGSDRLERTEEEIRLATELSNIQAEMDLRAIGEGGETPITATPGQRGLDLTGVPRMSNQGADLARLGASEEAVRLQRLEDQLTLDRLIAEEEAARLDQLVELKAVEDEHTEAINNKTRAIAEMADVINQDLAEAQDAFNESTSDFGGSITEMADAFQHMNDRARASGRQVVSTSEGMGRALTEVGEIATEQIGEGMAEAFAQSVAAAIQGGESFDKVMLKMTQSLLSNLLQMAIVEGLKELALGIADFASYKYDSGAMHMAAFGAWTAVAVAAGGALAAVSSASGGGGGGAGQKASDSASRRDSGDEESGGKTINIYYSNPLFNTNDEQARMIEQSLRRGGLWPDSHRA